VWSRLSDEQRAALATTFQLKSPAKVTIGTDDEILTALRAKFSVPPGYVRKKPPAKPKLDPLPPPATSCSAPRVRPRLAPARGLRAAGRHASG
jgi:hypothetical protein